MLVGCAAQRVDACVGEGEELRQLAGLQEALRGGRPRIIAPGRRLVKTGLLHKVGGGLVKK